MQVAEVCGEDIDCLLYDVRRRGTALVHLGATPNVTAAAIALGWRSRLRFLDDAERHMEAVALVATFCLTPPGDTASRKALFDAILFGCVPVLFYKESAYFPWHLPRNVSSFAVLLSPDELFEDASGMMRTLRRLPHAELAAKQAALRAMAHGVQYAAADMGREERGQHGPDALELALKELHNLQ